MLKKSAEICWKGLAKYAKKYANKNPLQTGQILLHMLQIWLEKSSQGLKIARKCQCNGWKHLKLQSWTTLQIFEFTRVKILEFYIIFMWQILKFISIFYANKPKICISIKNYFFHSPGHFPFPLSRRRRRRRQIKRVALCERVLFQCHYT